MASESSLESCARCLEARVLRQQASASIATSLVDDHLRAGNSLLKFERTALYLYTHVYAPALLEDGAKQQPCSARALALREVLCSQLQDPLVVRGIVNAAIHCVVELGTDWRAHAGDVEQQVRDVVDPQPAPTSTSMLWAASLYIYFSCVSP